MTALPVRIEKDEIFLKNSTTLKNTTSKVIYQLILFTFLILFTLWPVSRENKSRVHLIEDLH